MTEVVVVPFVTERDRLSLASECRAAWITSSIACLRAHQLEDRYLEWLSDEAREVITTAPPTSWLPLETAMAHYEACESLGLSEDDVVALGAEVVGRAQGGALDTAAMLARGIGGAPWTIFAQAGPMWGRTWRGGGLACFRVSAHEARFEIAQWPCARVPYCRIAMRGVLYGIATLVCEEPQVEDVAELCSDTTLGFSVTWE